MFQIRSFRLEKYNKMFNMEIRLALFAFNRFSGFK